MCVHLTLLPDDIPVANILGNQGRTWQLGNLYFTRWAGWSTGQVGRYVKC